MISYYKYTAGEAFTLNGIDYQGFFTVSDGNPYTGKRYQTGKSEILTPKQNFISEFYLNNLEFDNQFEKIEGVQPYFSNSFDVLNKTELDKIFQIINRNNLIVFKSLILQNPQIVDFDENNCHYYAISSSELDEKTTDVMTGKQISIGVERFQNSEKWAFLGEIKYGDFVVKSDQSFKYLCSTGNDLITVKGSFDDTDELTYEILPLSFGREVYDIYYDEFDNKIYVTINDLIYIYEGLNFIECDNFVISDTIQIKSVETIRLKWNLKREFSKTNGVFNTKYYNRNENEIDFMKFGGRMRTTLENNVLTLFKKNETEPLVNFKLSSYNITNVISIDIRDVDDLVSILHGNIGNYQMCFFNPNDVDNTIVNYPINNVKQSDVYTLKFSSFDSNIIFLSTRNKVESRFISNPTNTAASFREFSLKYPPRLKFGDAFVKIDDNTIKWNVEDSNLFTNINFKELSKGIKNYNLLHNSGRLYALKHNIRDTFYSAIDRSMPKYYNGLKCSNDSFGILFNKELFNITKDMLTLYTKATNCYIIKNDDVLLNRINQIEFDLNNLRINGNESVNTVTMQRIFSLIVEIQEKLIANLITIE